MADEPQFATFYVDDSSCEILGKKHFVLAAVTFKSEDVVLGSWIAQKQKFGLAPYEEVRWNAKNLTISQRRAFVPLATDGTGLIVIDDRTKQDAAIRLCQQAWSYCDEMGFTGFRLRFDQNIVTDWKALKSEAKAWFPPCVGLCEADSTYEHLIQAADFLAGSVKLQLDFGLGTRDPNEKIVLGAELAEAYGISGDEGVELGWFMFASLRHCVWGNIEAIPDKYEPWKTTSGRGLIVHSSLPERDIQKAISSLDGFYMGCIH